MHTLKLVEQRPIVWITGLVFAASKPLPFPHFRTYLKARNGLWYKQTNPLKWGDNNYEVLVEFGDLVAGVGHTYEIVCVNWQKDLANTYTDDTFPRQLALSPIYTVKRDW